MTQKRATDYGLNVGTMTKGPKNKITDVPGVLVGHTTIDSDEHKTGVTVIIPGEKNPFTHKLPAANYQYNGFGKTTGLMQMSELGTMETPIALTNTLNVGLVHDAIVSHMVERCEKEDVKMSSVNPVIAECNDASLNHIASRPVKAEHVFQAIEAASDDFLEGCVGAGTGTVCHGLKGGIGSASRIVKLDEKEYTVGVLVQSNHGILGDLMVCNEHIGKDLTTKLKTREADQGSIIIVIATDLPMDSRQLGRIAKRASVGLARMGSFVGHGSGEVFLAFSTANAFEVNATAGIRQVEAFHEEKIDDVFRAVAEATEESILNSMLTAHTTTGYKGRTITALTDLWDPQQ